MYYFLSHFGEARFIMSWNEQGKSFSQLIMTMPCSILLTYNARLVSFFFPSFNQFNKLPCFFWEIRELINKTLCTNDENINSTAQQCISNIHTIPLICTRQTPVLTLLMCGQRLLSQKDLLNWVLSN